MNTPSQQNPNNQNRSKRHKRSNITPIYPETILPPHTFQSNNIDIIEI